MTSTQDVARDLPIGFAVIADHQSAGRGRLDHRWDSPAGTSLLVSFVLHPNPLLSLAAGVAAAQACGPEVRLKWPNDLLLGGCKLGGILVEATPEKAVCGIGINLDWAPVGGAALHEPREEVFMRLAAEIEHWSSAQPSAVLDGWRRLSDTLGRRVRVQLPDRVIEGIAQELGTRGELIVDGIPIAAGSVTHLPA
ncbi:MAG: biotin--[acetyl-CoA-carboxylase] ligase [Candidatus Dormibacterales bacterium]